jgi:hypothetical protein
METERNSTLAKYRNALESVAAGHKSNLLNANAGDAGALGKLAKGTRSRTSIERMKVCTLRDDVQSPELMSTAEKRDKYSDNAHWSCPRPPLLNPVDKDTEGYTNTTEGMQNNCGNNYAWLFRERPVNLLAQEELLNMISLEQSLPPNVVDKLGAHIGAAEIQAAITLLKDGKAPDSQGAIAEQLKANAVLWSQILEITFDASYKLGQLSVAQRFGEMSLLFKKKDPEDLQYYRTLAMCSQLYKLYGLIIAERWKQVLPSQILEDQHGFIFLRSLVENIFKVKDTGHYADIAADAERLRRDNTDCDDCDDWEMDWTTAAYICDRTKAFDRVSHLWLIRVIAKMCGMHLQVPSELSDYWRNRRNYLTAHKLDARAIQTAEIESAITQELGEPPNTLKVLYDMQDMPPAVKLICVMLNNHSRRVRLNGGRSAAFTLLCSIFQGCTWAPTGWAAAAEPEGIAQLKDPEVIGIPSGTSELTTLSARYADDTWNMIQATSVDALLDNGTLWCMASSGGNEPTKQALMWRGALRNSGQIWHKSFDTDPAPAHARTRFIHAHQTVESLGILDGGSAYPGAKTLAIYDPKANTPQQPSQVQLDRMREELEWGPVTERMIDQIRLHSRHFLTYTARIVVLRSFVWSIAWYLYDVNPLPADSRRMKYLESATYVYLWKGRLPDCFHGTNDTDLTEVARTYTSLLKKDKSGQRKTHGGLNMPRPSHTGKARLTAHVLQLLAPRSANLVSETGASGYCYGQTWLLEAMGCLATDPIAAIIENRNWRRTIKNMKKIPAPNHWIETVASWKALVPHIHIATPTSCEEALSMPIYGGWLKFTRDNPLTNASATRVGDLWSEASSTWRSTIPSIDLQRLNAALPHSWLTLLRRGRDMLDVDDWFFLPTTLPANTRVLHASTGTLHHILGALYRVCMRIDEAYYELSEYLLGCNEQWLYQRTVRGNIPQHARRATVEPSSDITLHTLKVTGLTEHSWADSRARLTWADSAETSSQQYVILSNIGRRTEYISGMRKDGSPQMTTNAKQLLRAINPHPSVNLQTALRTLDSTNWTTAVKNFAWSCTANCLPSGYSCSRGKHDRCPICGTATQSVYHEIAKCPQLKAARQWLAEVTRKVVPQVTASSIPAFVIYGHHRTLANQRNATALRECFYAQWRAQRNAAISGHRSTRDQVRDNLNKRLRAGILRDWTRGSSPPQFNKRWLPYASHGAEGPCFHQFPSVRDGTIT